MVMAAAEAVKLPTDAPIAAVTEPPVLMLAAVRAPALEYEPANSAPVTDAVAADRETVARILAAVTSPFVLRPPAVIMPLATTDADCKMLVTTALFAVRVPETLALPEFMIPTALSEPVVAAPEVDSVVDDKSPLTCDAVVVNVPADSAPITVAAPPRSMSRLCLSSLQSERW